MGTGSATFGDIGVSLGAGADNLGNVTVLRSSGPGKAATFVANQGINRVGDITIKSVMSIVSARGQHFIDESGTLQEATLSLNKKIESLPPGIYYLSIVSPTGNYVERLVKL